MKRHERADCGEAGTSHPFSESVTQFIELSHNILSSFYGLLQRGGLKIRFLYPFIYKQVSLSPSLLLEVSVSFKCPFLFYHLSHFNVSLSFYLSLSLSLYFTNSLPLLSSPQSALSCRFIYIQTPSQMPRIIFSLSFSLPPPLLFIHSLTHTAWRGRGGRGRGGN